MFQYTSEDRYEKDGRSSLFSALVHSRTDDMEIKLTLPELPNASK